MSSSSAATETGKHGWLLNGIRVMDLAKRGAAVTLNDSSCIGCGICVDVCPVDVLHYDEKVARAAESVKIEP